MAAGTRVQTLQNGRRDWRCLQMALPLDCLFRGPWVRLSINSNCSPGSYIDTGAMGTKKDLGRAGPRAVVKLARQHTIELIKDGFVHSRGLGAVLFPDGTCVPMALMEGPAYFKEVGVCVYDESDGTGPFMSARGARVPSGKRTGSLTWVKTSLIRCVMCWQREASLEEEVGWVDEAGWADWLTYGS